MSEFDKNIPIPEPVFSQMRKSRVYRMEIGDSFALEKNEKIPSLYTAERIAGFKILTRKTPHETRVWRIK